MFIDSRPVTGYGETAGWQLPPMPQEPATRLNLKRPPMRSANSSTPSLAGMEQTIAPAPKRPPTDTSSTSSDGFQQSVMPFQEFIRRTPPPEESKPLPPTPLVVRRSSFGDNFSVSSRGESPPRPRRSSSVYSRTVSQWLPESPVWSISDLAENPMPVLPQELLQPIAYSASTPELVEKASTGFLLEPRTYQPLLTTPSPTISRQTTPSPAPTPSRRETMSSILLPTAVEVAEIPKTHLRTVSLEKAKATSGAPGAEHLLPEELREMSKGKTLAQTRSLEPIVRAPQPIAKSTERIRKDTLAMFKMSVDLPPDAPALPKMTLVDAEGRDRVVGSPRLSVAPLPTFSFPDEPVRNPISNAFPVGKNAPKTMVSLTSQDHYMPSSQVPQPGPYGHERGRSIQRGPRNSGYGFYHSDGRRQESPREIGLDDDAGYMAQEYYSLLAEQNRQASASSASRSMKSDVEVGEHMRMVPQPLFHGKPFATQHGQVGSRYDSVTEPVSPFNRQYSDSSVSFQSQRSGEDRLPSLPYRLSITTNNQRRRSSIGTIPISPPFQYSDHSTSPPPAAMPNVPQPRRIPMHRRNSNDNRVSAYWHIPTKGGNELVFRRSKEKQPSSSPKSPGVPLLAPNVVAQRLKTPEVTPEHSPLFRTPWPIQHTTSAPAPSYPQPTREESPTSGRKPTASKESNTELTAKQALLARITKGAAKYAEQLTRPAEPRRRSPSPLSNNEPIARTDSPHLFPGPAPHPPSFKPKPTNNHAKKPSLGWSNSSKAIFDSHHIPGHQSKPSQTSFYTHTLTPPRPLDERNAAEEEDSTTAMATARRGSINLFATFRDLRRETKAEKRREEIKKSIRVVGVPEGAAAAGGDFVGGNERARGRSADGKRAEEDGDAFVRPGGWGRRSISWMGGMGGVV